MGEGGSRPPQVNGWDESKLEESRIRMVAARKGGEGPKTLRVSEKRLMYCPYDKGDTSHSLGDSAESRRFVGQEALEGKVVRQRFVGR